MTNPICFYHSGDMDGKCSAAIIKKFKNDVELYPIDYQDIPNFPWDKITKDREVIMVDFSLPRVLMERIFNNCLEFTWIDHHKTAIDEMKDTNFFGLRGISNAACELTWKYCFDNKELPQLIYLIGRWDVWDHVEGCEPFHYGIDSCYTDPNNPIWLDYDVDEIIDIGNHIISYQEKIDKDIMQNAFPITFCNYKAIAINAPHGSKKFNQLPNKEDYEIYICFIMTNNLTYRVSLYTEHEDIDVGKLAKQHGGGGHKKAAGFIVNCNNIWEWLR